MIARVWRGVTRNNDADEYERLLKNEILQSIKEKQLAGHLGVELFKRTIDHSTEFMTIMFFESIESIKVFAGEHYENAVVPESARKLLIQFDAFSQHYTTLLPAQELASQV